MTNWRVGKIVQMVSILGYSCRNRFVVSRMRCDESFAASWPSAKTTLKGQGSQTDVEDRGLAIHLQTSMSCFIRVFNETSH